MSKYYKEEDVIAFLNLHCPKEMWEYQIADLPTIEVSEDCISREWVKGICEDMLDEEMLGHMLGCIENAPSVVPTTEQSSIVRCKDCTHYHAIKDYAYCTVINVKGKHPQPTDYCSYAEEK